MVLSGSCSIASTGCNVSGVISALYVETLLGVAVWVLVADPGKGGGGSDKYIHNWRRVREGACPVP